MNRLPDARVVLATDLDLKREVAAFEAGIRERAEALRGNPHVYVIMKGHAERIIEQMRTGERHPAAEKYLRQAQL